MSPVVGGDSWWMQSAPGHEREALTSDLQVDVCVVGAGAAGLLTAWELVEAGHTVCVIDRGRIAASVTGYTTSKLTAQHGLRYGHLEATHGAETARHYAGANERALEHIIATIEQLGIDAEVSRRDAWVYAGNAATTESLRTEVLACERAGLPARFTEDVPLPFDTHGGVVLAAQAQLHPRRWLLGIADALEARGCHIYEQTKLAEVTPGAPVCVTTDTGATITAHHLVVATLLPSGGIANNVYAKLYCHQGYAVALPMPVGDDPLSGGIFINADRPMRSLRMIEGPNDADVQYLQVGGSAWVANPSSGDSPWDELERWGCETFGAGDAAWKWTTQDYSSSDSIPLIGRCDSVHPNMYIAAGFGGWGLTNAGVAAELITQQIGGDDRPWHAVFDPRRELADASTHIVSSHRHGLDIDPEAVLEALKPGEALVLERGGEEVAAHRDAEGTLHCVSAVCTHLRGMVLWDADETEWVCPCHASRFAPDGTVTRGPAKEPLPQR